jgi:transposase
MSAPMVRACLDGSKTQTRRPLRPQPDGYLPEWPPHYDKATGGAMWGSMRSDHGIACPYGQPGDRLWVKETFFAFGFWEQRWSAEKDRMEWHFVDQTIEKGEQYQFEPPADYKRRKRGGTGIFWWKRPAIFMPRVASRIDLEVTGVCVQRLQECSEVDAVAEGVRVSHWAKRSMACQGIYECTMPDGKTHFNDSAYELYRVLWDQINGAGAWDENSWVWVVEFKRIKP